jgi:hypothetical protein
VPQSGRKDSAVSGREKSSSPFPHSTSTDSYAFNSEGNGSSSLQSYSSGAVRNKNVLDDPGDDIQFMDDVDNVDARYTNGRLKDARFVNGHGPKSPSYYKQDSLCVDGMFFPCFFVVVVVV